MSTVVPPFADDDLLPIHHLNNLLFCERRAAMQLIERMWHDNQYTSEGLYAHKRVDLPANLKIGGHRRVFSMWLVSHRLGLVGKADLVEFHPSHPDPQPDGIVDALPHATPIATAGIPYPVDFKRGRKRRWDNNEVQLCAQALCLEEMLQVTVPCGAIFHIRSNHRQEVHFDSALREKTDWAARRLHELYASGQTPLAKFHPKCRGCSLLEFCMPQALRPRATASRYLNLIVGDQWDTPAAGDEP
jgi:CRISPR-associated exonuclease Cas4